MFSLLTFCRFAGGHEVAGGCEVERWSSLDFVCKLVEEDEWSWLSSDELIFNFNLHPFVLPVKIW